MASSGGHIEVVKKAIEFKKPTYVPLELWEMPGIFEDYGAKRPNELVFLPRTEDFDVFQVGYNWLLKNVGTDREGNRLCKDEWGCVRMLPKSPDHKYLYLVVEEPLADWKNLKNFVFPSIAVTDNFFSRMRSFLRKYPDRFRHATIDPGPVAIATDIMGYEHLLTSFYTDADKVKYVLDGISDYHLEVVKRWIQCDVHMISYYDSLATDKGLVFSPEIFRRFIKPGYKKIFDYVHKMGLYVGVGSDGDYSELFDDFKELGADVLHCSNNHSIGLEKLAKAGEGGFCIEGSIDMHTTLPLGSVEDIYREAEEMVKVLGGRNGGFIANILRYPVMKFPGENLQASIDAFNKYRFKVAHFYS